MSGTTDKAKGRIREAAGLSPTTRAPRREGKLDQTVGKVKNAADEVMDKVRETVKGDSECHEEITDRGPPSRVRNNPRSG